MNPGTKEDAERMFLGAVLTDNTILLSSRLESKMFGQYRPMFDLIVKLAGVGTVKRSSLLIPGLTDREKELRDSLDGAWSSSSWVFYHDRIIELWGQERLHEACKTAANQPLGDARETMERALSEVDLKQSGATTKPLRETLQATLGRILAGKSDVGIPFGIGAIDRATMGARQGQLVIIAARPSQGKSALMAHLARNMARRTKVGVVTIESDENELTIRLIAGEARIDSKLLIAGKTSEMQGHKLKDGGARLAEIQDNMLIHDHPGISLVQLQATARRMAKDGVKVLFLDYLQLVKVPDKESKREEVAEVSTSLKAIARELKITVVALAQLSRDADEKRPHMGNVQHSSQLEQDADQVWLIWHKKSEVTTPEGEKERVRSYIILDKVRDGETGDVEVTFERSTANFFEVVREEHE